LALFAALRETQTLTVLSVLCDSVVKKSLGQYSWKNPFF